MNNEILIGTPEPDTLLGGNGADIIEGGGGDDELAGGNGEDSLYGGDGNDLLNGGNGADLLEGGDGDDELLAGNGDDALDGGDGDDTLDGGKGDDFLDGGAGSDLVFGGKGDDSFNYTLSENAGATDTYDGGSGFDTLQLTLTTGEWLAAQEDIAAFQASLAAGGGGTFFGLTVSSIEALTFNVVEDENTAPVAMKDFNTTNEDTAVTSNADTNLLANDDDADGDALVVSAVNGDAANVGTQVTLASGALLTVNTDGSYSYDPNGQFESLGAGETAFDSFSYDVSDGALSATAEVEITIEGVDDAPAAIRVAVVGAHSSINNAVVGQLTDEKALFDFDATSVLIESGTDWTTAFADFDVVVLGEDGITFETIEHDNLELFSALNTFILGGGGVVTTGLFAGFAYEFAGAETAETVSPVKVPDVNGVVAVSPGSPITVTPLDAAGEFIAGDIIADGQDSGTYFAQGQHEVAVAGKDDDAQVLAKDADGRVAIAYDSSAAGRTVYLGSLHMHAFGDAARVNETTVDELFERAVAWAAGEGPSATSTVVSSAEDLLGYGVDSTLSSVTGDADALL